MSGGGACMMSGTVMALYFLTLILSLILIFRAADRMLLHAVAAANRFHIPPLIIGSVVIGFGTSAPELVISSVAALEGSLEIAVGNALGSNIANIALVLGAAAVVSGIGAAHAGINLKFLIVLAATVLPAVLLLDERHLGRVDGAVLLGALAVAIYLLIKTERNTPRAAADMSRLAAGQKHIGVKLTIWMGVLVGASYAAVWSAVHVAQTLGISELIIGLTVIALGTSLPELAAALVGAYRKQHAIAFGNILGSNMFNSLAVIGLPALIYPAQMPAEVLSRDYVVVFGLTILLWLLLLAPPRLSLGRAKGLLLLACFVLYQTALYHAAVN